MKSKLLILIMIGLSTSSFSQQFRQYFDGADTVYNQGSSNTSLRIYFDTDTSNIWQVGQPQKRLFDTAATSPNALMTDTINFYPANNRSSFELKILPWTNWGVFALQWKQKLDMDMALDGGIIEYSVDSGNTWINVFNNPYVYNYYGFSPSNVDTLPTGDVAFTGTDTTWKDIWLCFSMPWISQFNDTIRFKFTFQSDSVDNDREGWMIDNLVARLTMLHTVSNDIKIQKYVTTYPNPASDIIHIETQKLQEYHIIEQMTLINSIGQVVEKWNNIPTKFYIDVSKYPNGNYYLKVKTNIKSEVVPIIIKHN